MRIAAIIATTFFLIACSEISTDYEDDSYKGKPQEKSQEEFSYYSYDTKRQRNEASINKGSDIVRTYISNEINGDRIFKDKYTNITLRVDKIGTDVMGAAYISYRHNPEWVSLTAYFESSQVDEIDQIADLKIGDIVKINCAITGKALNVVVANYCYFTHY